MIDRTLTTYTFINYLISKGRNQLDLYVPLACKCILKHRAQTINIEDLVRWFKDDYGLNMYRGVFDSLIKLMAKQNLVRWEVTNYFVNDENIISLIEQAENGKSDNDIEYLCNSISVFIKDKYDLFFSREDIQDGLLTFFYTHDGDMLFNEESLIRTLERQRDGKTTKTKIKYIISKFIIWSVENEPISFQIMKGLSKAHAVTSIISMKDVATYTGKMKNVTIALDTPIVFNLLGLNAKSNCDIAIELMGALQQQHCKFIIYKQHLEEVKKTFSSAIHLLYTKEYVLDRSSRLLKYAVKNKISSQYLRLKQQQLDSILETWNITIETAPDYPENYTEINIEALEQMMIDRYKESGRDLDDGRMLTIQNDVDVISYIYRLRGNNIATNLKNSNAILITTNTALAYASKQHTINHMHHDIPVCMTDRFLSAIMWFAYPQACVDINENVLLSECYKNITLSDEILHKFYDDVQKINKRTPLTEEQVLNANTSFLVQELLENKTYNDPSLYTDTTAAEILEEIDRIKNGRIYELDARLTKHKNRINSISKYLAVMIVFILWAGLVALFLFLKFVDYREWNSVSRCVLNILSLLPALWGLLCWFECIPSKQNTISRISMRISNRLSFWFDK